MPPPAPQDFYKAGGRLPNGVWEEILAAVAEVEAAYGGKFADPADPLLFSVRSGAAVSMPVSGPAPAGARQAACWLVGPCSSGSPQAGLVSARSRPLACLAHCHQPARSWGCSPALTTVTAWLLTWLPAALTGAQGMMDTVLNLGLNDEVVEGLAARRGERFAYDCYRRLLDMFGDVVLGIDHALFEAEIHAVKASRGGAAPPRGQAGQGEEGACLALLAAGSVAPGHARRICWHSPLAQRHNHAGHPAVCCC